ncbi:MAG: outer membrane beta-barrel protein [Bacteroidota bacterium]
MVKGKVSATSDRGAVVGATVVLINIRDSTKRHFTATDNDGNFTIEKLEKAFYKLRITSVGFKSYQQFVRVNKELVELGDLAIEPDTKILDGVEVKGDVVAVEQKGDTTQINAKAYKTNPDANAEDLIRKMPGIIVDNSGVQAQGEAVQRVLVDGREFFGNDPTLALRSLPAQIVDKIEVFDQLSDQSQFSGFNDGNTTKTINIVTKADMRDGVFGRAFGGAGTEETYNAGGNINFFNQDQRISVVGLANNINQQNFSTEDIAGIASGSSRRRRGRGGSGGSSRGGRGGSRGGSNVNNFLVGQQEGISETQSFGVNYGDKWGKKITLNGSYFFNRTDNNNNSLVNRETFLSSAESQFYNENSLANNINYNHRFNLRMEYQIDQSNSIIFTPRFSVQQNEANESIEGVTLNGVNFVNSTSNQYLNDLSAFNFSGTLLFRHRFQKRGRTFSIRVQSRLNGNESDATNDQLNTFSEESSSDNEMIAQLIGNETDGNTLSTNLVYTEPIGDRMQLQLNYNLSYTNNDSDRLTFNYDGQNTELTMLDTALSNTFQNDYITHRPTIGLMYRSQKWFGRIGVSYQHAELISDQVFPSIDNIERNFDNVLPTLFMRFNISKEKNLRIIYRTQTDAPSISQLQNVVDNTNALFNSTGNPDLKQSFGHTFITRYSNTNTAKSKSFYSFLLVRNNSDYITNATFIAQRDSVIQDGIILNRGSQLTKPINVDGNWNIRSFSTLGLPLRWLKSNLNINAGLTYNRVPGVTNGQENISNTYALNSGFVISSNVSENVDFTVSYTANYNIVDNTFQSQQDDNYLSQNLGTKLNLIFGKGFVFRNDLNYQKFSGFTDDFNLDFVLWNMSFGKKFLKDQRGELQLSVFDLLAQNNSVSRENTEGFIEETRTQVLRQYFMLTFTYTFRKFGVKSNG